MNGSESKQTCACLTRAGEADDVNRKTVLRMTLLAVVLFAVSLKPMPWGMDRVVKQAYLAPPFVELGDAVIKGSQHILK